jgi:hypothetical protein
MRINFGINAAEALILPLVIELSCVFLREQFQFLALLTGRMQEHELTLITKNPLDGEHT